MKKSIGTKVAKRVARGDKGINQLDAACREHDIAYETHKDSKDRYQADLILKRAASKRIKAKDASFGERVAALAVTAAMKTKTGLSKLGAGLRKKSTKRKKSNKKPKDITFKQLVKGVRINIAKSKPKTVKCAVKAAIQSTKKLRSGKRITGIPRIIKVPSISGGLLPIIPVLSGLAAAGTIANSAVGIYNAIKNMMSGSASSNGTKKIGSGLYLTSGKRGKGMYLRPYSKN